MIKKQRWELSDGIVELSCLDDYYYVLRTHPECPERWAFGSDSVSAYARVSDILQEDVLEEE